MNIYAILRNDNSLKRISLTQELQEELDSYINSSIQHFEGLSPIKFSGEYKPDEDQILFIENFKNPYSEFVPTSTEILEKSEIDYIKTIVFVDSDKIAYQCFDSRKIIKPNKWFLIYSRKTFSKINEPALIIDAKIDALYFKEEKKLLFLSYHNASKIFDLSEYYREATDSEINHFLNNNLIQKDTSFNTNLFNSRMRKKLHLIIKNNVLEKVERNFSEVVKYAEKFKLEQMFDKINQKIIFPSEKKDLEKLIKFLNEDLFESPITGNKYEINSKHTVSEHT